MVTMAMDPMPSVSVRKHIRRGSTRPGKHKVILISHLPCHTLVLTSRGRTFVDVRVLRPKSAPSPDDLPNDPKDPSAISQLEWAFAGTSTSTQAEFENGKLIRPPHTVWTHWVDSTTLEPVRDEGDMYEQANGDVLEKGFDVDPATGTPREYEELWQDLVPEMTGADEKRISCVLKLDNENTGARGMLIRIGSHIQGLKRVRDQFTVIRWHWEEQNIGSKAGQWKRTLAIHDGAIPCESLFSGLPLSKIEVEIGQTVVDSDGDTWACIETFQW